MRVAGNGDGHLGRPADAALVERGEEGRTGSELALELTDVGPEGCGQGSIGRVVMHQGPRAATAVVGQRRRDGQALGAGEAGRAAAVERGQPDRREVSRSIGPQVPRLLDAPVHPGGREVGRVLEVERQAREVGVRGAQLAAQAGQRLVERIGVHRPPSP